MRLLTSPTLPPCWQQSTACKIAFLLLSVCFGSVAYSAEPTPSAPQDATYPTPPPGIAQEIADIQRRLGGSIVEGRQLLAPSPPFVPHVSEPRFHAGRHMPTIEAPLAPPLDASGEKKSPAEQKVELLRTAAAQLDVTASQLESTDLYTQADALRKTAQDFRLEARKLRSQQAEAPTQ
ncbi:MAG: hypothetical protein GXP26_09150 [Planctomycetes bacterium]|nr:hypothetical protein [Planctomycetota bacterium]